MCVLRRPAVAVALERGERGLLVAAPGAAERQVVEEPGSLGEPREVVREARCVG